MLNTRFERLNRAMVDTEIAGIILNAGPSLMYYTGLNFHLMERPVVLIYVQGKEPSLILPRLESAKIEDVTGLHCYFYDENPEEWCRIFKRACDDAGVAGLSLGVEPLQLRLLEYSLLKSSAPVELIDGSSFIHAQRSIKDEAEIELMQKAVDIAQHGLQATLPLIKIGMTEKELAGELVVQLLRHGSGSKLPFSPIVSAGPNGANPHAGPSERTLKEGDLLVIDWGASYEGYVSDITRTFAIGEIDEESVRIHDLVQQANSAGRAAGVVGATCADVDRAARRVIEEAGYGKYFTHRTGHGIGMQCHEEPYIRDDNELPLQAGMTYTVEPGIYLPAKNGVRIEDDVLVTHDGTVSLSTLPRRIIRLA